MRKIPNQGPDIEKLFQKLGVEDRTQILDKIHTMRMKAFDRREYENLAKPHHQAFNPAEKSKLVEQYYMAKRQMNGQNPRISEGQESAKAVSQI